MPLSRMVCWPALITLRLSSTAAYCATRVSGSARGGPFGGAAKRPGPTWTTAPGGAGHAVRVAQADLHVVAGAWIEHEQRAVHRRAWLSRAVVGRPQRQPPAPARLGARLELDGGLRSGVGISAEHQLDADAVEGASQAHAPDRD